MQFTRALAAAKRLPDSYHNMPSRFIERQTNFVTRRSPRLPQYERKIFRYKTKGYYDQWRPWEGEFQKLNQEGVKVPKIFVEPLRHTTYFRGDRVEVLKGADRGKQGIINYIVKDRNWVYVHGLNLRREYTQKTQTSAGIITCKEEPYLMDHEVKLVDPSDLMPTDVEWRYDDDGNRLRVSTRTERVIPVPNQAYETIDYTERAKYREQPKDTPAEAANKVTFKPAAKTFEMDICDEMGIKDDRVPYPMYWY